MSLLRSLALGGIIALVVVLLAGIQQYRIMAITNQVTTLTGDLATEKKATKDAVDANLVSQATISTLQAELERNKKYAADLNRRIKASEAKAKQARADYEKLKRSNPAVRNWADQPLPDGLRGKPAGSGDKDVGGAGRRP